ncbi:MAG: hypothetical protein JWN36_23 [Microbacteriaceae bacterium]|nr:hypothetical protein [Microbacteriaceae bacterium]
MRRNLAYLVMTAGIVLLAGCAGVQPSDYVGQTLAQVEKHAHPGSVADVSSPVLGKQAAYNENADASGWIVVAACNTKGDDLTVAVIPAQDATTAIRERATKHKFQALLDDCRG